VEFDVSNVHTAALILARQFNRPPYLICDENTIRVYDRMDMRGEINRCFVENRLLVTQVSVHAEKLEDYFSDLIGGGRIG
jgi:hypothetical protein